MRLETAPEPVTPQPGLPRTIGVLNLLFGMVLLLWGAASLYALGPFLRENDPMQLDPVFTQSLADELRREMIGTLQGHERSARDGARRQRLIAARAELESARTDLSGQVDFGTINGHLPWVSRYLIVDTLTGPALNLAMCAAGLGLVALRRRGRTLALWVAGLKLARLVAMSLLLAVAVVPALTRTAEQLLGTDLFRAIVRGAIEDGRARGVPLPAVPLKTGEIVRILSTLGYGYALMGLGLGAIYPLITLVVLRRPGAVAACGGSPDGRAPARPTGQ